MYIINFKVFGYSHPFRRKMQTKLNSFDRGRNILDDFREAYYWLWQNTDEDARVMSWYQCYKTFFFFVTEASEKISCSVCHFKVFSG